jgi:[FeFe] hydrogenase H-cluster maturation GTPase HydF
MRLHIAILGRRNVGKSSILNAITRQQVAIVSAVAGTTTDPVEKAMEFAPFGPVVFVDTAGLDDEGALGALRVGKTHRTLDRVDLAVVVAAGEWGTFEEDVLEELLRRATRSVVVFNKSDKWSPPPAALEYLAARGVPWVSTRADTGDGIGALREALGAAAPPDASTESPLVGDLVGPGGLAVLVAPIDKEAPKGRLILPQVQAIRDLLESDALCLVVKERELRAAFARLREPPQLVVTDSQAFLQVVADTPTDVPLTSFSILLSRYRGDLVAQVAGALAIDALRPGDRVLVAEACTHHPTDEDIGRVKLPRWLTQYAGGKLEFTTVQGHDFPDDLSGFRLAVLCGGCTINRREVLSRIGRCREAGVPVTNYGLAIAFSLGIFERALGPFPGALAAFREYAAGGGGRRAEAA